MFARVCLPLPLLVLAAFFVTTSELDHCGRQGGSKVAPFVVRQEDHDAVVECGEPSRENVVQELPACRRMLKVLWRSTLEFYELCQFRR